MATTRYHGTVTTSGNSEAIRLETALFRAHPEFRQKGRVTATVIATGQLLISVDDEAEPAAEDDPALDAFLAFLADDIRDNPGRIEPLSSSDVALAVKLTEGIDVAGDDDLGDDVTI